MACYQCRKTFNFIVSSRPCDECGINFCSKCLKYKQRVNTPVAKTLKLCYPCYEKILNNEQQVKRPLTPPKLLLERLKFSGIDTSHLLDGTHRLVDKNVASTSVTTPKDKLDMRSKELIGDCTKNIPQIHELEERLRNLTDGNLPLKFDPGSFEEPSESEKISRIINEYTEKAKLDALYGYEDAEPKSNSDDDEQPWCMLCNANAYFWCSNCEYLFCYSCAQKQHAHKKYKNHDLKKYVPKKKAPK